MNTTPDGVEFAQSVRVGQCAIETVSWSPDGGLLALTDTDSVAHVYDIYREEQLWTHRVRAGVPFAEVVWSEDGETAAFWENSDSVAVFESHTGRRKSTLAIGDPPGSALAWSRNGSWIACGSSTGSILIWDASSGRPYTKLEGLSAPITTLAWSADPWSLLAAGGADGSIGVWDVKGGFAPRKLAGHYRAVNSVAWAANEQLLASGAGDSLVRVWDPFALRHTYVGEGHTRAVNKVSFSADRLVLASSGDDGQVRFWRCGSWDTVAVLHAHAPTVFSDSAPSGRLQTQPLAFHPARSLLATGGAVGEIIIWRTHSPSLLRLPSSQSIRYISAKVVLLGEANVGKSCLAMRLAEDRYAELGTTHGMRFWSMGPEQLDPQVSPTVEERREIVLWDMGGQDEYRLLHQLFLANTTLALLLFDPTRGRTAYEEVRRWNKYLEGQLRERPTNKLLIATKLDSANTLADDEGVNRLREEGGFAGYYKTSARTGHGIEELRKSISAGLDWSQLASVSRPALFQAIHDAIRQRRARGDIVVLFSELTRTLAAEWEHDANRGGVDTVVEQLAIQGELVDTKLPSGDRALILDIAQVERYAGSLIVAARANPRGIPVIDELAVASPSMHFPGIDPKPRLDRRNELWVLQGVVELLLHRGICFRHEGLLIFPSLFDDDNRASDATPPYTASLQYYFSGELDNAYASLVSRIALAERFGRVRLADYRAEFDHAGKEMCGLHRGRAREAFAVVAIYFAPDTSESTRALFITFVEDHLRKFDVKILEHLFATCPCGFQFDEGTIRQRVSLGFHDIGCPICDTRVPLIEDSPAARNRNPNIAREVWALKSVADNRKSASVDAARAGFRATDLLIQPSQSTWILHLSDLHLTETTDIDSVLQPLVADLRDHRDGLGLERLDYMVVSGDLTNRATPGEFEKARCLVSELIRRFGLSAQRCIVVPGNHDLNWDEDVYRLKPARQVTREEIGEGKAIAKDDVYLMLDEASYPHRFGNFSKIFYHPLFQQEYSLDPSDQFLVEFARDAGLQFIAMNSSWEIDEYHTTRSSINQAALSRALDNADKQIVSARRNHWIGEESQVLRCAVLHHPITGNDKIIDDAFVDRLRQAGVRIVLHGHVHEDRADVAGYLEPNSQIYVVGAGSFGAPTHHRPESVPRLYNVLEVDGALSRVRVHTRQMRRGGGRWEGWARWPGSKPEEKLTYYDLRDFKVTK